MVTPSIQSYSYDSFIIITTHSSTIGPLRLYRTRHPIGFYSIGVSHNDLLWNYREQHKKGLNK